MDLLLNISMSLLMMYLSVYSIDGMIGEGGDDERSPTSFVCNYSCTLLGDPSTSIAGDGSGDGSFLGSPNTWIA